MDLGSRIRNLREVAGLSQRGLARKAGFKPAVMNRIEKGKANPTVNTLQRIADALGVPLVWLFIAELVESERGEPSTRPLL